MVRVLLSLVVGVGLVGWSLSARLPVNDRSGEEFVERFVDMTFDTLPKDAILFVEGDSVTPVGYYRYVENRRPDITIYDLKGLMYRERLYDPLIPKVAKRKILKDFLDTMTRPLFFWGWSVQKYDLMAYGELRFYGFFVSLNMAGPVGAVHVSRDEVAERYFRYLVDQEPADRWSRSLRYNMLYAYGDYLGLAWLLGNPHGADVGGPCGGVLCLFGCVEYAPTGVWE